jgi:hypothetical protein
MPSEKAAQMGDESKAAAVDPPAALLFEWNNFADAIIPARAGSGAQASSK